MESGRSGESPAAGVDRDESTIRQLADRRPAVETLWCSVLRREAQPDFGGRSVGALPCLKTTEDAQDTLENEPHIQGESRLWSQQDGDEDSSNQG